MENGKRILIGMVIATIFLISMGTIVVAEKVSQYELVQECYKLFDAQAYADYNAWCYPDWVPENDCAYSGCRYDIVQDKWRCINAYETDMVNVPGYLECVNPHMDRYLECLKKANEKQRSIRVNKRVNNKGKFEPNFRQWRKDRVTECQEELFPAIETCQEEACIVYCIEKGAPGGEWSGSSWRGSCKCDEIPKETNKEEYTLTLEHYEPYYESKDGDPRRAGDLVATLKDKNGKGVSGKRVFFYVAPGTKIDEVLVVRTRSGMIPAADYGDVFVGPIIEGSYLGYGCTDKGGVACWNYLLGRIKLDVLSSEIIDTGNVKGALTAVVFDEKTNKIEQKASINVEFSSIAKIVEIRGEGQPDFPPTIKVGSSKYEYTVSGPGRVRVKRLLVQPQFDYKPVEEGFELMPGDIINIDGGVDIEIVWVNANRVIAKVPKMLIFKTGTVPNDNLDLVLMATAYESGFYTDLQKWTAPLVGLTISKGIDLFISNIPVVGSKVQLLIDIRKAYEEVDLSKIDLITRIRIRSKVIVDQEGDEINVYTIEGSPDIKTVKGEEVTLADKEMVAIAEDGSLSEVQSFDPEEVLNEFFGVLKGSITIKTETSSTIERETVKLTVMGVAGDPIRVESSPLSDKVLFKEGIDDTPTGANYHVNWFTDTIDADGIRRYAVEFNDMGIYTIKVTVTGGDREGDLDTVELTVLEKEVPLDLRVPIPSELEISKLYVGKSVYPRGTEVDVHYNVKNIGTVDVNEYHVEYKINDFKGNEVYKFVGSTRSIASGEQQKFVAAKKWEIPSDARIGPYIIDCTLIWDSKKDTAGREFFVTHPAKREDRTAELEISNLYTGKSEYLKGAGERVDVCYYVKNTGAVDISEYHVIYQIFDSEGKRYCWFISDMFGSIVAGKEDKWQSGVCNVPSDAKVGRYTVDAMVIWGLDRFSRETVYFFVN